METSKGLSSLFSSVSVEIDDDVIAAVAALFFRPNSSALKLNFNQLIS